MGPPSSLDGSMVQLSIAPGPEPSIIAWPLGHSDSSLLCGCRCDALNADALYVQVAH